MDITQRPIHCTDKKREVLYVKDENLWQKEDQQNKKVRTAIKKIADKNMRLLPHYKEKYPDCNKSASHVSDKYNTIIIESMGGKGENDLEKENKIISNISKEVFVVKE
jgi:predicted Rossmann fold nucleotide-binding protein DprA/Smf involved in DNA uptake